MIFCHSLHESHALSSSSTTISEQLLVGPAQAENERLHLLTFLQLKQPGPIFRFFVLLAQVSALLRMFENG